MNLYVGTSGYSFKEWKGTFYPKDLPDKKMLHFYGERFRTVEINNTFYRMPKASVLQAWGLRLAPISSSCSRRRQRITHMQRLKDADTSVSYLLEVAGALKERLGPLLFQFAAELQEGRATAARVFSRCCRRSAARRLSSATQVMVRRGGIRAAARSSGGAVHCRGRGHLGGPFVATADWGYLRLRRPDYGRCGAERRGSSECGNKTGADCVRVLQARGMKAKGHRWRKRFLELAA